MAIWRAVIVGIGLLLLCVAGLLSVLGDLIKMPSPDHERDGFRDPHQSSEKN